jgi:2-desacetyl-2-hydroxyethyl bacteriochlorophyllide A dehydrogenase
MRRYELTGRRSMHLAEDVPKPRPGPGEVLVKVGAATICNRSDLVYYHYLGERDHCAVGVFGHEVAGTIVEVGDRVTRTVPGHRVFLRAPLTGGFADFALAREISVGALPDAVTFEAGAILQLLPLAVHATRGVSLGDRVAILGQGPVGLMALQVAALRGAGEIVVADLDPWRLARSATLGADRTVVVDLAAEDPYRELGGDFDVAIEAIGTPQTANACVDLVRQNGLVIFLGTHHVDTKVTFDLVVWEKKGLRLHTAAEPTDADRVASMAVAERLIGRIDTASLVSQVYPLDELPAAITRLSASSVLTPSGRPSQFPGPPPRTLKLAIVP